MIIVMCLLNKIFWNHFLCIMCDRLNGSRRSWDAAEGQIEEQENQEVDGKGRNFIDYSPALLHHHLNIKAITCPYKPGSQSSL